MEILVYIQFNDRKIPDLSFDLISYAREIANSAMVSGVTILPVGGEIDDITKENLQKAGLDKLYILKSGLMPYDKRKHPYLLISLIENINPKIFILNSTTEGREIAPVVASSLRCGLTADCTKLEVIDENLISTRPTFGGKLMASIISKKTPQMATVRENTFKRKNYKIKTPFIVKEYEIDVINKPNLKTEILNFEETGKENFLNLKNAKIVLAGGLGLKNKENFDKLKQLAELMGAKVGATRKAVDKGFIEKEYQIGQTGCCVTPEIYIAFGISGAIHHIVGMDNSKKIIAINTDKNAPIFKHADIGIIENAKTVLDYMIEQYENKN